MRNLMGAAVDSAAHGDINRKHNQKHGNRIGKAMCFSKHRCHTFVFLGVNGLEGLELLELLLEVSHLGSCLALALPRQGRRALPK